MEIKTQIIDQGGKVFEATYKDEDPNSNLGESILHGSHALCFCDGKLLVVRNKLYGWGAPGGTVETGENYTETIAREIEEESNMRVIHQKPIGYLDVWFDDEKVMSRQARSFCIVEPLGEFDSDPDGDIFEIKLIDPKDYREYIRWGEIGDHLMERATEMLEKQTNGNN